MRNVNYQYNIRGWLTDINNVDNLSISPDPVDLFAFSINYNEDIQYDVNGMVRPLYNGNIAETTWRTASDNTRRRYAYSYDYLNRLRDAWYQVPGSTTPVAQCYNEHLTYDSNGNILSLFRYGEVDDPNNLIEIDDLEYEYDLGNKLINVVDNTTHSAGFNDGNQKGVNGNTDNDFEYDTYGNLIKDRNKEIDEIVYNHLNLPKKIIFENENTIEYLYDASGTKLRKIVTDNTTSPTTVTTTHYLDGFQYIDDKLEFFPTAEGYVKATHTSSGGLGGGTTSYNYVFNYTDHLGNIRLRYALNEDNWMVILEEDHYYPFGLKHQGYNAENYVFATLGGGPVQLIPTNPDALETYKYKYNSHEWQDEFGLNVYDYGARMYMPDIGRWGVMDNLSELYFSHSSYVYALNTPVQAIDPDGNIVIFINGMHTGDGGKPDYWRTYRTEFYTYSTDNWTYNGRRRVETSAFDTAVMNHLGDNNALYRDGSMGGASNTVWASRSKKNLSVLNRENGGYAQGKKDAEMIIKNLARDKTTGEIIETIKIITHSMGAAYGKGYVKALKQYIKTLPKDQQRQIKITLVADFDPFQAGSLRADSNIFTQQFTHLGGRYGLAEERQKGLNDENYYEADGDHSIFSFFNDISNLQEGTYNWNGEEWICTTCNND